MNNRAFAEELNRARLARKTVPPLRGRADLTVDDAYAISLDQLEMRRAAGERIIGKKIGVTSKAVQDMLGVHEPDFGFLTDVMQIEDGAEVRIADSLIQPRAEAEIAFVLRSDLTGPEVTADDVLKASKIIAPCIEVVDSRVAGWDIKIIDTVADNASCGVFVMGGAHVDPRYHDLSKIACRMFKNGKEVSSGVGADVLGSPLASVAWLANTLGRYNVPLLAGDIILSGSMVPLEPVQPGDEIRVELAGIGGASVRFT